MNLEQLQSFRRDYQNQRTASGQVGIDAFRLRDYNAFIARIDTAVEQQSLIEEVRREESLPIDDDIDYNDKSLSMSNEVKELLSDHRPATIGAATRIPGVTPAAIVMLLYYMRRQQQSRPRRGGVTLNLT